LNQNRRQPHIVSGLILNQIPLDTFQPGFLKEDIFIQLDDQLNIQMEVRFGGANGTGGMDVDIVSVCDEVVVDVVVEQGMEASE